MVDCEGRVSLLFRVNSLLEMRSRAVLAVLLLLILAASRAASSPDGEPEPLFPGTASPSELLEFYAYPGRPTSFSARVIETADRYLLYMVTWQSSVWTPYHADNRVTAYYYQPRHSGKVPAVVVLHSYGTRTAGVERDLSAYLAGRGIACILPYLPYHGPRTPADYVSGKLFITGDVAHTLQSVRQAIVDIRGAADWLQSRPEVDPERIGIVGVSLGGILVNLAMGVDERFASGVAVLGGGEVADIIWKSVILGSVRRELEGRGITLQELRRRLRVIEPLTYAQFNRPRQVLMINGRYDIVVPPFATRAMWRALGEPPIIWLDIGHYGTVLVPSQVMNVAGAYLLNHFGERSGPLPKLHAYTVKLGVFMDEASGLSAGVGLAVAELARNTSLDLTLTTQGVLLGASYMVRHSTELGVGVKLGEGDLTARPYLAVVLVL